MTGKVPFVHLVPTEQIYIGSRQLCFAQVYIRGVKPVPQ